MPQNTGRKFQQSHPWIRFELGSRLRKSICSARFRTSWMPTAIFGMRRKRARCPRFLPG